MKFKINLAYTRKQMIVYQGICNYYLVKIPINSYYYSMQIVINIDGFNARCKITSKHPTCLQVFLRPARC